MGRVLPCSPEERRPALTFEVGRFIIGPQSQGNRKQVQGLCQTVAVYGVGKHTACRRADGHWKREGRVCCHKPEDCPDAHRPYELWHCRVRQRKGMTQIRFHQAAPLCTDTFIKENEP